MTHKGFSHIGLSTLDLDKTRDFYENIRVELCIFHLLCNELDVVGRSGGTPPRINPRSPAAPPCDVYRSLNQPNFTSALRDLSMKTGKGYQAPERRIFVHDTDSAEPLNRGEH